MDKRTKGMRSKVAGDLFEAIIEASCEKYKEIGEAIIEKTAEPMRVLSGMDQRGQFKACFEKKAQPDFKGVLEGGTMIAFEAKHTDKDVFKRERVTEKQLEQLKAYEDLGACCYVLISFRFERFFMVPFEDWEKMKEVFGRNYIKETDLNYCEVKEEKGWIKFLDE